MARGERLRRVKQLLAYPDAKAAGHAREYVADAAKYEHRARHVD